MQATTQMPTSFPEHIYQLAEQHQLGQPQALYRRHLHRFLVWFLPVWLALAIALFTYYGYGIFISYSALNSADASYPGMSPSARFWGDALQLLFILY